MTPERVFSDPAEIGSSPRNVELCGDLPPGTRRAPAVAARTLGRTQPFARAADNDGMSEHPLMSWLFVACLRTYGRPWFAHAIARTMFDDERLAHLWGVIAFA